MDTALHLNQSSSVVQRVLRLRQRIEQSEMQAPGSSALSQELPVKQDYQRQSWQKSDSSLNGEDTMSHRCSS